MRQEVALQGQALVDAQAARDSAVQQLVTLSAAVGPAACAAAGIDAGQAQEGRDAVNRGHLERIAELEREVGPAAAAWLIYRRSRSWLACADHALEGAAGRAAGAWLASMHNRMQMQCDLNLAGPIHTYVCMCCLG